MYKRKRTVLKLKKELKLRKLRSKRTISKELGKNYSNCLIKTQVSANKRRKYRSCILSSVSKRKIRNNKN